MKSRWTEDEEKIVNDLYNKIPTAQIAARLNRTVNSIANKAKELGLRIPYGERAPSKPKPIFENPIPSANRTFDEIVTDQAKRFRAKQARWDTKHQGIKIKLPEGPYGIVFIGDPHVDDNGCDFERLSYDLSFIQGSLNVYGALMGDLTNNWVGKLRGLYAHQNTTDDDAVVLMEALLDFLGEAWLFVILGNHDKWGPTAELLCRQKGIQHVSHGGIFHTIAGEHELIIDARHTHQGNSMYNPSHAQLKRSYRGSPADIIIGAHTHTSAYTLTKNGVTGKVGHALRVGAYKRFDEYADQNNFDDGQISPSVMAVINPSAPPESAVVVFHDLDAGKLYLDALRGLYEQGE